MSSPTSTRRERVGFTVVAILCITAGTFGVAGAVNARSTPPSADSASSSAAENETEQADAAASESAEAAEERAYTDAHRDEVAVTQAEAESTAQATKPGDVVESHLQTEHGEMRWEVKTDDGSTVWEIQIDPGSGSVTHVQADD